MNEIIADIDYNYFGYAPEHPAGILILTTIDGYDIARREFINSIGYRYLTFAHTSTEADARAIANTEYSRVATALRAAAVVKDLRNVDTIATTNTPVVPAAA